MKILLGISLILNLILGVLYYKKKNEPPIERIILEHSAFKETKTHTIVAGQTTPHAKAAMMVNTQDAKTEETPIIVQDEQNIHVLAEDVEFKQKDFLEQLDISEEMIQKKEKYMQEFFAQTNAIYQKDPFGVRTDFTNRRKLIDLEEKLHLKLKNLFGQAKWDKYKKKVDDYNVKGIKAQKSAANPSMMMMNY